MPCCWIVRWLFMSSCPSAPSAQDWYGSPDAKANYAHTSDLSRVSALESWSISGRFKERQGAAACTGYRHVPSSGGTSAASSQGCPWLSILTPFPRSLHQALPSASFWHLMDILVGEPLDGKACRLTVLAVPYLSLSLSPALSISHFISFVPCSCLLRTSGAFSICSSLTAPDLLLWCVFPSARDPLPLLLSVTWLLLEHCRGRLIQRPILMRSSPGMRGWKLVKFQNGPDHVCNTF